MDNGAYFYNVMIKGILYRIEKGIFDYSSEAPPGATSL